MGLSFYNQRRAKEKEKQKLNVSTDSAETLINAKDDASLPLKEEEGLSLESQLVEEIKEQAENEEQNGSQKQKEEKMQIEEAKKVSDAQKIKNAKQKANKTK